MEKLKEAGEDLIVACLMQVTSILYLLNSLLSFCSGIGIIIKNLISKLRSKI